MYNLAKLITEEPQKIERLVILFSKLLITLYLGEILFGLNISISEFIKNPLSEDYKIINLILNFAYFITAWVIIWTIIGDLILGELIIWILSKVGNSKNFFYEMLEFFSVIEKKGEHITPNKNVIVFNSLLQNFDSQDENLIREEKSRIRQYYIVATITYITLLLTNHNVMPLWLKVFGGIMIANFFLGSILLNKLHNYFINSYNEMKPLFAKLAYYQTVSIVIKNSSTIDYYYEKSVEGFGIKLNLKNDNPSLPETIRMHPYSKDIFLAKEKLSTDLLRSSKETATKEDIHSIYKVQISNIKLNESDKKHILSQPNFAYLYCENKEQIKENINLYFYKLINRNV